MPWFAILLNITVVVKLIMRKGGVLGVAVALILISALFSFLSTAVVGAGQDCTKAADCNACENCDIGFFCQLNPWCKGTCVSNNCDTFTGNRCEGNSVWYHEWVWCGPSGTTSSCQTSGNLIQDCSKTSTTCCSAACADTKTDANNCGTCGNKCASGWSCINGNCEKPDPCKDNDGDGYDGKTADCSSGTDCNDANAAVWQLLTGYVDADGDGYTVGSAVSVCSGNSLPSGYTVMSLGTDCNDNDAAVYPGSCSPSVVTWTACGTSATGGCGTGTCTRALPPGCCTADAVGAACVTSGCFPGHWVSPCHADGTFGTTYCGVDLPVPASDNCGGSTPVCHANTDSTGTCTPLPVNCGNSIIDPGEVCDPGSLSSTKTKTVDCGSYPSITQVCRPDCSGYDGSCQSCGDGIVNGPEACEPGQTQQYTCPDGAKISQGCKSIDPNKCQWLDVSSLCGTCSNGKKDGDETGVDCGGGKCLACPTCSDGIKNQGETGIDCGGPCAACTVCTPNQVMGHSCVGCGTASESVCKNDGTGTFTQLVNDAKCTSGCPSPESCEGVELDFSQGCCVSAGFQWVKSGEHDAGDAGTGTKEGSLPVCSASDWKSSTVSSVSKMLGSDAKKAQLAVDGSKAYYAWEVSNQIVVVSANIDGSGAVETFLPYSCPKGQPCGGSSGFKVRAYNGKLYFAWEGGTSSNIYAAYVGVDSLKGGSKAVSASAVLPSGASKYMQQFDFAVGNDGPDYVYLEGGPCTSQSDDEGGSSDDCDYAQGGVFLAKPGGISSKIASWPKSSFGNYLNYWGGPLIAKDSGFTYYVWGEQSTEKYYYPWGLGFVSVYGVNIAVKGSSGLNKYTVQLTRDGLHGQAIKSGLDAVAVGGKAYISYQATINSKFAYNLVSFDAASQMEDSPFSKSIAFYTGYGVPFHLARAGNLVYAVWSESSDSIWLTYGSSKDEFVKNVKSITPFDASSEDYAAFYAAHSIGIAGSVAGSSGYVSYVDSLQATQSKVVVNGATGYVQVSCTGAGTGAAAGKASKDNADSQFTDSKGEKKATSKLLPNEERCFGDDADEEFFMRTRDCKVGVCTSNLFDKALCDKPSDCIYSGKCYSDIDLVAATFFGGDKAAAWSSAWQKEVAVDVNGDGKLEVCDPGQWQNPAGTVTGTVTDITSGAPIGSAAVNMVGTSNPALAYSATTAADSTYTINNVEPANYDMTASKAGYGNQVKANQPIQPFQVNTVNFQLTPSGGGFSGTVRNVSGSPVSGALVKVLGTGFSATTAADGTYAISSVPSGTYDLTASKPSDGYEGATSLKTNVASGTITVSFTLLHSLGSCTNDCTTIGSNKCDASCHGKGLCWFYNDVTKAACDGTFGIVELPGGKSVNCCQGQSYTPIKATISVPSSNIITTKKPVVYNGRLLNMVFVLFNRQN